jgi:uncharacterized membrane protein YfcA
LHVGTSWWVGLGAAVQGLSGLGFSLIVAPSIVPQIPGPNGVGTVNLLASVQNVWILHRSQSQLRLDVLKRMYPGLVIGVAMGLGASHLITNRMRGFVVAGSALLSAMWILRPPTNPSYRKGLLLFTWGAFVNTLASVGGPPISAYLIQEIPDHDEYIRTQQLIFLLLNLLSLPWLGFQVRSWPEALLLLAALLTGSSAGQGLRRKIPAEIARKIAISTILLVAGISFLRAMISMNT